MGLVIPNDSLAQIHIALLKGIPPVSKALDDSDSWVTVLCKKLVTWWPWVAEGKMPLVVAKGEEIPRYKGLEPTERLLMLKALCELRADQDDAVAYINDALKEGTEISSFRKEKIGGDAKRTSYWYDGNTIIGHRLYKEIIVIESKKNINGKGGSSLPNISFQWETVATNLEEFQKVTDELSSSKVAGERDAAKSIETDAIPALEKLLKKKEREVKKKLSQERQQNLLVNLYAAGVTRSCRNRRPVNYTFDDYDKVIHEAIKVTNNRKTTDEKVQGKKSRRNEIAKSPKTDAPERDNKAENPDKETDSANSNDQESGKKDDVDSGCHSGNTENDMLEDAGDDKDDKNWDDGTKAEDNEEEEEDGNLSDKRNSKQENAQIDETSKKWPACGLRWSSRLAGGTNRQVVENTNSGAKNRSRQRPVRNSALNSTVIKDSEDENSEGHENRKSLEGENSSSETDSEEGSSES